MIITQPKQHQLFVLNYLPYANYNIKYRNCQTFNTSRMCQVKGGELITFIIKMYLIIFKLALLISLTILLIIGEIL